MKIEEAKQKICPLNGLKCIVDKCIKWEFTKENIIYEYRPNAACKCGNKTTEYEFCYNCGECATSERAYLFHKDENFGELNYEDKEGECTL
jgi:hypothetical protein